MLQRLRDFGQGPILAVVAVIILATVTFSVFKASRPLQTNSEEASAQAQSATTPTAVPTKPPVPTRTPLPTIPPDPTSTPRSLVSPTPLPTALPPIVTSWVPYQSSSGLSLSYPAGWDILESNTTLANGGLNPQWVMSLANFAFRKPTGGENLPPSAAKVDIAVDPRPVPPNGTSFTVGSQQLSGYQFVTDYSNPVESFGVERVISIYFTAGTRQWNIAASFHSPRDVLEQNTEIVYQIVATIQVK